MTISEAISKVRQVTGQVVGDDVMLTWLSELDGRVAVGFFGSDYWRGYSTEDLGSAGPPAVASTELLIPKPWDGGIYLHWLAAHTYLANGEYDRYENERVYAETQLDDFRIYLTRTLDPACKLICEWTRAARPYHDGGVRNTNWMEED